MTRPAFAAMVAGIAVAWALCALAFPARSAEQDGSVSWFLTRLDDRDLADYVTGCRLDVRKADGWACRNAEVAMAHRYTAGLRRGRAFLRSPLFWLDNPNAAAVRRACADPRPHNAGLRQFCNVVPPGVS